MPRLEEVVYYLEGLWLLLKGKQEGYQYLDFSERGFWRSWWALVYCLPPTLLSYVATKAYLAADAIQPVDAGIEFYFKAAFVDYGSMLIGVFIFFGVTRMGGFSQYAAPIIIVLNWLAVPMQWVFSVGSLGQIFAPANIELMATILLIQILVGTFLSYQLINRVVGGKALATIAALLTLSVVPLLAQAKLGPLVSLWS